MRILKCHGTNEFYFHHKLLTDDHYNDITESVDLVGHNGGLRHKANPLNSDIHDLKLYKDNKTQKISRCEILDLYCARKDQVCLRLCADIQLTDMGQRLNCVWYDNIFEYGPVIGHIRDIEPEYKRARLHFGDSRLIDEFNTEVDSYFTKEIARSTFHKIKIIDCHSKVYSVEILEKDGKSLSSRLIKKFPKLFYKAAAHAKRVTIRPEDRL